MLPQNLGVNNIPTFMSNLSTATQASTSFVVKSSVTIVTIVNLLSKIADVAKSSYVNQPIMTVSSSEVCYKSIIPKKLHRINSFLVLAYR